MWIVVYMTQNKDTADEILAILTREGILVKLKNTSKNKEDSSPGCFEVLVPESEVEEAHNIIIDSGF